MDYPLEIGSLLATKFPEQYYDRAKYELPEVKSLLRIFDYCDNANMNSRESIDKLGKIFKEESAQNAFTAENWWTREKLKNYITRNYCIGPEPDMVTHRASGTENPYLRADEADPANSIQGGFMWMTFITGFWDSLSQIRQYNDTARQRADYTTALDLAIDCLEEYGHGFFPPCVREAIHELQDLIDVPRTDFAPAIVT